MTRTIYDLQNQEISYTKPDKNLVLKNFCGLQNKYIFVKSNLENMLTLRRLWDMYQKFDL